MDVFGTNEHLYYKGKIIQEIALFTSLISFWMYLSFSNQQIPISKKSINCSGEVILPVTVNEVDLQHDRSSTGMVFAGAFIDKGNPRRFSEFVQDDPPPSNTQKLSKLNVTLS